MVRSLHTPRIVHNIALNLARGSEKMPKPDDAEKLVRRACRFMDIPDTYDPDVCPTMRSCIKLVEKSLKLVK